MEFPYKTIFAGNCQIKALLETEERQTAIASLKNIPIDLVENSDLLGISFEAALANCINANDDGMSAENLVEVAKNFLFKPINLDHHRKMSTGFITGYSFTKYGSGELMTEDEAKASKDKFCISLTGVIWKLVNKDLASLIEETNEIFASWEIGFSTNNLILLPKGKTDYKDGLIITAEDKDFNKISDCLRANGGGGTWGEFKVCRDIILPALPLGIGLTENPAADVKNVVAVIKNVISAETEEHSEDCDCEDCMEKHEAEEECECESPESTEEHGKQHCAKCGKKIKDSMVKAEISQTESISTVINNKKPNKIMLTAIADINDEYLKTAQATEIREFLEKCAAESATKAAEQLKAAEAEKGSIAADLEKAKTELAAARAELEKLNQEKSAAAAQELFNKRMAHFDEKFELCEEAKKAIVARVRDIKDDEAFATYQKEMDIFLKGKEKGQKQVVASVQNDDKALDNALKNAEAQKIEVTSAPIKDEPKSFYEKYHKAFEINSENYKSR